MAKKKKFLFTAWPLSGHYYPLVAIAKALKEQGHEAAFYSGSKACSVVEKQGFQGFPFKDIDEDRLHRMWKAQESAFNKWNRLGQLRTTLRNWFLDTIPQQLTDLERIIADWKPDVIAMDSTMWGPVLVGYEKWKIPVAVASFVPACMVPGSQSPPFGLGLPNLPNLGGRIVYGALHKVMDVVAASMRQAANEIRKQNGLEPLTITVAQHLGRMPLYLVPSTPEFDYNRSDLPPSVRYVGPCLWNEPNQNNSNDWQSKIPSDQPWIHVTEGTFHTGDPILLRSAAIGLADLPAQIIMSTGGTRDPEALNLPKAPNIHLVRWVSHSDLFPLTRAVVTTGGAGTVLAALHHGVPLVVVPTEWDKPENAQRVADSGAGLRLSPKRCTPKNLRAAVARLLDEDSFLQNAQRLAKSFARHGGSKEAAQHLIELADRKPI